MLELNFKENMQYRTFNSNELHILLNFYPAILFFFSIERFIVILNCKHEQKRTNFKWMNVIHVTHKSRHKSLMVFEQINESKQFTFYCCSKILGHWMTFYLKSYKNTCKFTVKIIIFGLSVWANRSCSYIYVFFSFLIFIMYVYDECAH